MNTSTPYWRQIQRKNITSWAQLKKVLSVSICEDFTYINPLHFSLNIPIRLAKKITSFSLHDPIFRQFIPSFYEHIKAPSFSLQPNEDEAFQKAPKLLQKYEGRVLLLTTSACPMHCRFCFRQNYPYEKKRQAFEEEIQSIQNNPSLHEVILSGGDPLSLSDDHLEKLLIQLDQIPHIELIRFHTRFPIGIPERIDSSFLSILQKIKTQIIFTLHVNHVKELDEDVFLSMKKLQQLGIPILSQTVLLKGVNDTFIALKSLFLALVSHGILPYYLHQLDRVQGAQHFEVAKEKGKELIQALQKHLPGYAIPKYVEEKPHKASKTLI